jgi:uncharacterized protein (DUF1330 family)
MKEMSSNPSKERNSMKTSYTVTLAMLAGCAFGAVAVEGLHAQAKPPIYYVVEIDTTDQDAYAKEFAPKAQAIIKAAGGRFVAIGGAGATRAKPITQIEGEPPQRVVVMIWDNMQQIQQWWGNPEYAALRKVVDKYAKFRSFAVEGQ